MPPFNSPPWSGSSAAAELNAEVTRETLYDHRRRCFRACRVTAIAARRVRVGSHREWQHHSVLGECHRLRSCGYACIHALARNALRQLMRERRTEGDVVLEGDTLARVAELVRRCHGVPAGDGPSIVRLHLERVVANQPNPAVEGGVVDIVGEGALSRVARRILAEQ